MKPLPVEFFVELTTKENFDNIITRLYELGYKWSCGDVSYYDIMQRNGTYLRVGGKGSPFRLSYGHANDLNRIVEKDLPYLTWEDLAVGASNEFDGKPFYPARFCSSLNQEYVNAACRTLNKLNAQQILAVDLYAQSRVLDERNDRENFNHKL